MPGYELFVMTDLNEQITYFENLFSGSQLLSMTASDLLLAARKFSKIEEHYKEKNALKLINKKIAVLASYTTHHLLGVMKLFLYKERISPQFYEGEFDGITMGLLDPDSEIFSFQPEILLLLTDQKDIKEFPPLSADQKRVDTWIQTTLEFYTNLWQHASSVAGCQIFQTSFILPIYRPLGNMETNHLSSPTNCLKLLNLELVRKKPRNVTFIDMDYYSSYFGKRRWFDDKNYYLTKQGFSFDAFGLICAAFSKILSGTTGNVKKCLVLDLDNTLWGGVIGDDGPDGINLNSSDAVGEAFISFQKYLKKLRERGIILAICSKNDEDVAKAPFENHPEMVLSLNDIAFFLANWENKATNIQTISNALNIGIDSLVYFDDNPFERDIVKKFFPQVQVIEVPEDPALYVHALDSAMCFEWNQLTEEDLMRSDTYVTDRKRERLSSTVVDYDGYLQALEMKAVIGHPTPDEIARFVQLINKSNQFNLRTRRYSDAAISQMAGEPDKYSLITISLEDKFGKYGIISCIILIHNDDSAFIDTWVMSCRVLKRGVELAAFNAVCDSAREWGCNHIVGEYIPTKKNHMVADLLPFLGFERSHDNIPGLTDENGNIYRLDLPVLNPKKHHIKIEKFREPTYG
jgi:FkbH-like protein